MILIGEKLNSSIPATHALVAGRDRSAITDLAFRQAAAGANWLDLNAGMFAGEEAAILSWMAEAAAEVPEIGLVLDSPDPAVLAKVASGLSGRRLVFNSATLDPARLSPMTELALRYDAGLVVLPITGHRMPETIEEQTNNAMLLLQALQADGLPSDRIYLDILVIAAAVDSDAPSRALRFARDMRAAFPAIHLTGGMSNISFGLPARRPINAAFLSAAICAGVDAPILDVLDRDLMHQLSAAVLISGQDEYCADYLAYFRANRR